MKARWLFFDVGSTLIDETECYKQRIRDAISGTDITFEQFNEKRIEFAKMNLKSDIETINFFGLKKTPWHKELERPYPDAENVLRQLSDMDYKIGIIANQSAGTAQRLEKWGLMRYISLVLSSAEEGVSKPDPEIFRLGVKALNLSPENVLVVGDSYKKDIVPSESIGCQVLWLKGKGWTSEEDAQMHENIISSLNEIAVNLA
mgnify:CR=1 FL=1